MSKMTIFGEAHFETSSVRAIEDAIRVIRPTVIIHELLDRGIYTPEEARKALLTAGHPDSPCDPETNIDVFRLGVELNAKLIGCDLSDDEKRALKSLPLFKQFVPREERMLEVFHGVNIPGPIVAVVGDIHLRSKGNRTFGPSLIYTSWEKGRLDADIVRAPKQFQEMA